MTGNLLHLTSQPVLQLKPYACLFEVLRRVNSILVILRRQFTIPCFLYFFLLILNKSIILALAGQLYCFSRNPDRRGGKPLLPVLKTLTCRDRGPNPRPPAQEALTTRPPQRLKKKKKKNTHTHTRKLQ